MSYETIDDLIYEVNRVALLPDAEVLRKGCIRHVQTVYRKVGNVVSGIERDDVFIPRHMSVQVPETTLKIMDVKYTTRVNSELKAFEYMPMVERLRGSRMSDYNYGPTLYEVDGNKIRFFSDAVKQVLVKRELLPTDDEGNLLIDSRIYDACISFCRGEELMVKASNAKQERSTLNPASFYINQAKALIDEARAEINRATYGQERAFRLELFKDQRTYENRL